jgi:hypothetical protein
MKFFANTRSKRNTSFVVLLAWLFALASGVVNACLLETPRSHSHPHSQAVEGQGLAATASQAPAEWVAHGTGSAGHGDDADNAKESCLKVCDDGTNALPKASSGVDHTDPGPAALVSTKWAGSTQVTLVPRRLEDLVVPSLGPPLRVRYSRLAL